MRSEQTSAKTIESLIRLEEQKAIPVDLLENEAGELASRGMDVCPTGDGLFNVDPGSIGSYRAPYRKLQQSCE